MSHSIFPTSRDEVTYVMRSEGIHDIKALPVGVPALSVDAVRDAVRGAGLVIPDALLLDSLAALRAGKHLMFRGAPGTGKTTLAVALAQAAADAQISGSPVLTTGTADWTSVETIGTYRMTSSQGLKFRHGHVLAAMAENRWLVIDELNRSDIDKAIGQLFTVLSGHAVTLPFEVDAAADRVVSEESSPQAEEHSEEVLRYVSIVPPESQQPDETVAITIERTWRLIATLNDRDQDLLFDMSEALQRRFAILDVPIPTESEWLTLLDLYGRTGNTSLDKALQELIRSEPFTQRPLGPALILDAARHMRKLMQLETETSNHADPVELLDSALDIYVRPHLRLPSGQLIEISAATLLRDS